MKKKVIEYGICPRCHGKGKKDGFFNWDAGWCHICGGHGKIVKKEEIYEEE